MRIDNLINKLKVVNLVFESEDENKFIFKRNGMVYYIFKEHVQIDAKTLTDLLGKALPFKVVGGKFIDLNNLEVVKLP